MDTIHTHFLRLADTPHLSFKLNEPARVTIDHLSSILSHPAECEIHSAQAGGTALYPLESWAGTRTSLGADSWREV